MWDYRTRLERMEPALSWAIVVVAIVTVVAILAL